MLILQGWNLFLEVFWIRHHPLRESFSCLVSHCFTSLYSSLWDLQIDRILHTFIISLINLVLFGDTNFDIQSTTIQESLLLIFIFFRRFLQQNLWFKVVCYQFSIFLNFCWQFCFAPWFSKQKLFSPKHFFHST